MTRLPAQALSVARPVVSLLIVLNAFYAVALVAALIYSFFIADWPARPFGGEFVVTYPNVGTGLRWIVVIGVVGAAIMHTILVRLRAIVDSVRDGDPFIVENAERLEAVAWRVLSLEVLRLFVAGIAALVWEAGRFPAFSVASCVAVLLLFVLAGVFAQGARMRADLEGTV